MDFFNAIISEFNILSFVVEFLNPKLTKEKNVKFIANFNVSNLSCLLNMKMLISIILSVHVSMFKDMFITKTFF